VEKYAALRALCNANAASALAIRSETAVTLLGASHVGAVTSLVIVQPDERSLSAASAGATTQRNTGDV
jgi:hypothetical protein